MLSNVAVNSLGEMVSPCRTPLLILICSLSLCRCRPTVTELSGFIGKKLGDDNDDDDDGDDEDERMHG